MDSHEPDHGTNGGPRSLAPGTPEHQLQALYSTALDALFVLDDERRCIEVNEPGAHLLHALREEVVHRPLEQFTAPGDRAALGQLWSDLERRGSCQGKLEMLRGDGLCAMVEFRATWDFGPGQHLLAAHKTNGRRRQDTRVLTPRELEVLQLAADGHSLLRIAEHLVLSPGTVKTHFQRVYKKLGAHDRASAVAQCLRRGLIE